MDSKTLALLEFDRIQNLIAERTQTDMGRELALKIQPLHSREAIEKEFDFIDELLKLNQEPNLSDIVDLRYYFIVDAPQIFSADKLKVMQKTFEQIRKVKNFFINHKNLAPKFYHLIKELPTFESLEILIDQNIDEFNEIKSDATPNLKRIRKELTLKRTYIISHLEKLMITHEDLFQEHNFVLRQNRYCLPLKIEMREKIPGIVHEFSTSGKTAFVEPLSLIEEQNDFARLKDEEREEIQRILNYISNELYQVREEILTAFALVAEIDVKLAKKRFAQDFRCTRPQYASDGCIKIINGRHPLLILTKSLSAVIPLNFHFPIDTNVILISGPNAGGKTVVLKTVGLFALMFSAGLFLPAEDGTRIPLFNNIFADIGDEQSLDANLSSFSAHLLRIKEILAQIDNTSLVLLDEIGASTSPEEGSALAIAILEKVRDVGAYCLATSHLNPLKAYVHDAPGMKNAAMEFIERPTYRFVIGLLGVSNALEISQELGLPSELIERARMFLDQDWLTLAQRLKDLATETERLRILNDQLAKKKEELDNQKTHYESLINKFKAFEKEEKKKLSAEYRRLLIEQRRNIENLVRAIKESNAEKQSIVKAKKFIEEQLAHIPKIDEEQNIANNIQTTTVQLKIGDQVYSQTFQKTGTVVATNAQKTKVAFGSIQIELPNGDLVLKEPSPTNNESDAQKVSTLFDSFLYEPKADNVINIRGMTKEEAMDSLERFLDYAYQSHIPIVSVLHGKGKGILKEMVWDKLKKDPRVEKIRFGEIYEGGMGITKVFLKYEK
ncbi:MAG: Smr/MutS family protein [candidate division WOR-3 bacterium]